MVDSTLVFEGMMAAARVFKQDASRARKAGDASLAETRSYDADDVENAVLSFKATGDLGQLVRSIMDFDTEPREIVLEKLVEKVGREPLEATGEVKFLR